MSACLFRLLVHSTHLCMACCCSSTSHFSGLVSTTDIHLSVPGLAVVALCMAASPAPCTSPIHAFLHVMQSVTGDIVRWVCNLNMSVLAIVS